MEGGDEWLLPLRPPCKRCVLPLLATGCKVRSGWRLWLWALSYGSHSFFYFHSPILLPLHLRLLPTLFPVSFPLHLSPSPALFLHSPCKFSPLSLTQALLYLSSLFCPVINPMS